VNHMKTKLLFIIKECTPKLPEIDMENTEIIEIPLDMKQWTEPQKAKIEGYDVFHQLKEKGYAYVNK